MGDLGERCRDAGDRLSNKGAIWEGLCLIAPYCTANSTLLSVSNGVMHLSTRFLVPVRFCTSTVTSSA